MQYSPSWDLLHLCTVMYFEKLNFDWIISQKRQFGPNFGPFETISRQQLSSFPNYF